MKKPLKNYNGIDYIEVSREEIQQATELASELQGISLDDLSLPARNLLQLLLEMDRKIFTRKEVMDYTGWTKTLLHIHLTELIRMELVLPESTKKNQFQTYKLLYNSEDQDGRRFMLGYMVFSRCSRRPYRYYFESFAVMSPSINSERESNISSMLDSISLNDFRFNCFICHFLHCGLVYCSQFI